MSITVAVFSPDVTDLKKAVFSLSAIDRLNFGPNGFGPGYIAHELMNESGAAVLLLSDDVVVGYTAATDARLVYQTNPHYFGRSHHGAAYISNSSIHPGYQRQGHIWPMMDALEAALRDKQFTFLDRDTKADLGYAAKVVTHYGDRVIFAHPPEQTMWGSQSYIRIRL